MTVPIGPFLLESLSMQTILSNFWEEILKRESQTILSVAVHLFFDFYHLFETK
jgi:hypothetical protein